MVVVDVGAGDTAALISGDVGAADGKIAGEGVGEGVSAADGKVVGEGVSEGVGAADGLTTEIVESTRRRRARG